MAEGMTGIEAGTLETTPAAGELQLLACPECGMKFASPQGRGRHRRTVHGIIGKYVSSKMRQRRKERGADDRQPPVARRGRRRNAPATAEGDVGLAFGVAICALDDAGKLVGDCVAGLERLTAATRKLRLAYIVSRDKLRKLQAEAKELEDERE